MKMNIRFLLQFGQKGKKILELDGEEIKRFANYLGEFPSVAFSSRDFRLVRDGPSERRKWLDLVLSSSSKEYFEALRLYHRSLRERNAILKRGGGDKELDAFEKSLISSAFQVFQIRLKSLPTLSSYLTKYYHKLSDGVEEAGFKYRPDLNPENEEDLTARIWKNGAKTGNSELHDADLIGMILNLYFKIKMPVHFHQKGSKRAWYWVLGFQNLNI